jgi:hypothetical protein
MFSVAQIIKRRMIRRFVNNELETTWMEAVAGGIEENHENMKAWATKVNVQQGFFSSLQTGLATQPASYPINIDGRSSTVGIARSV